MDNIMDIARNLLEQYGHIPRFSVKKGAGSATYIVERIEFFDWSAYGYAYGQAHYFDGVKNGRIPNAGCFDWYLYKLLDGECESFIRSRVGGSREDGYQYSIEKGYPCV